MSFKFDFTEEQVRKILKMTAYDAGEWYDTMRVILPRYSIDTVDRVAGFLAQTAHESLNYTVLTENLNYNYKSLDKIFPKYFVRAGRDARDYHRKQEKIANVIYANRMDNGSIESGDGWKFRGGGILQITGRHNYTQFGKTVEMSAEQATEYVRTKQGALESACWFWETNNINRYCDSRDIVGMSRRINGGRIGLKHRKELYAYALEVLGERVRIADDNDDVKYGLLRKGSTGAGVRVLQKALGLTADGIFGSYTERVLKTWQRENGLVADGICGPQTLSALI